MTDKIKSAFDEIKAEDEFRTSAKYFLYEKYNKAPEKSNKSIRRPVFAAVCAFLVVLSCVGIASYSIPVSAISLDYDNSCVELGVNSFDKVVTVTCFGENDDIENLKLKNKNYREAVTLVINSTEDTDSSAVLSVNCKNPEKCKEISEQINQCNFDNTSVDYNSQSHHGLSSEAHSHGISTGKYNAYLELKELDPDVNVDEIKNLPMKEIRERIYALSPDENGKNDGNDDTQDCSGTENTSCHTSDRQGSGQHHGKNGK